MKKVIALACMLVFTCAAAIALMAWPAQAQLQNDLAAEMFALTNAHRVSVGLPALLHGGASAQAAANTRAAEIHLLTRQQIDDHERPNGDSFVFLLMDYGLPSTNSNENLLPSQISSSASAALGRFLDSTAHRNTIQRALYTHMAVGVYEHNGRFYWVQFFLTFTPGSFPETTAPGGVTTTTTTTTTTTATTAATTTAATTAATTT
ncbi:MAG: hypothetical protein FWB76_06125, partial [Oscillospiraceae bacterium]|nr:hypothetical protein [Oscillospiraceae bacterium]